MRVCVLGVVKISFVVGTKYVVLNRMGMHLIEKDMVVLKRVFFAFVYKCIILVL